MDNVMELLDKLRSRQVQVTVGVVGIGAIVGMIMFFTKKTPPTNAELPYLICDPGPDPYNSTTITVTNNTTRNIPELVSNVFRCEYEPDKIKKGYFYCDSDCNPASNPNCLVGKWDQPASKIVSLDIGQSVTFTMTVNPCEIAQIDTYNPEVHALADPTECYNTRSQYTNPPPPNWWPGGIAFGIAENSTGYNATTGTCPQPTATPQPTPPPTAVPPTQPPVIPTATPPPTAEPGQPTYTPYPTATPIPYVSPATPQPTQPVSGSVGVTVVGILGGIGLLLLSVL